MTDVCQAARDIIFRGEGLELQAYPDPATGSDPWTIGYGHTGKDVTPGLVITRDEADALFEADLAKFASGVDAQLDGEVTDNEFGAMVSLAYNIGLGNFEKSSVLRLHNSGQHDAAANAFLLWNKANGQVFTALDRRRHEERALYLTP